MRLPPPPPHTHTPHPHLDDIIDPDCAPGIPPWTCNVPNVVFLQGIAETEIQDTFRVYFGGADTVVVSGAGAIMRTDARRARPSSTSSPRDEGRHCTVCDEVHQRSDRAWELDRPVVAVDACRTVSCAQIHGHEE